MFDGKQVRFLLAVWKKKLIKRVKRSVQAKKISEFVRLQQISLQNKIVKKV